MEEKLSALGQAGADEEKAWGFRGIQGKTGRRQHWTLGTLDGQLQVSDWGQEQQMLCEWKKIKLARLSARSWTCAAATGCRISSLPPHVCRSRVGLPDTRQPLPSPRSSCHATLTNYRFLCTASDSSFVIDVLFLSRLYALQNTHVANSNAHRGAFVIAAQPRPNALTIRMYMLLVHQTTCSPLCCYVISTHFEASAVMPHLYASHLTWHK